MADITVTAANVRPLAPCNIADGNPAGEQLTVGQAVVLNSSEQWVVADASSADTSKGNVGIVVAGNKIHQRPTTPTVIASGEEVSVLTWGRIAGFTGLSGEKDYYLSDTAGKLADAAGTVTRFMGHAEDTNILFIEPAGPATSA